MADHKILDAQLELVQGYLVKIHFGATLKEIKKMLFDDLDYLQQECAALSAQEIITKITIT